MLGFLLSLVNPVKAISQEILKYKIKQVEASTTQAKLDAETIVHQLEMQQAVLIAEQQNFLTRMIRPLWSLPFVIFTWKIIVWDIVLGLGVTENPSPQMYHLMMIVAGSYFLTRGVKDIFRTIRS